RLAVRSIFLLPVQEDGRRLVFPVRRAHGFGRSGGHLQARAFLPARARDGAQRRARIRGPRDRAWPPTAPILCAVFILRLSDRYRRHRDLGLRGPVDRFDFLNPPRASPSTSSAPSLHEVSKTFRAPFRISSASKRAQTAHVSRRPRAESSL